jgi:hypothetical protein
MLQTFHPGERASGAPRIGSWEVRKIGVNIMAKRKS